MPDLVTIGEASAVFAAKKIGRMRYSSEFELKPGGAEATVAVGVVRLGHSAGWVSKLGDDELGHYILSLVKGEGVDVSQVSLSKEFQTAVFLRERLPKGAARHFYYRKDSAFSNLHPEELDEEYVKSARIIHLSGITPAVSPNCKQVVLRMIEIARLNKIPIVFDPNMRKKLWPAEEARAFFEQIYPQVDYVLPGIEDIEGLYGSGKQDLEVVDMLLDLGCRRVVLKCGAHGAIVGEPGKEPQWIEHEPIEAPEDLMGAGDAFAAGFIAGVLEGLDLAASCRQGNEVARMAIQLPGNIEAMPTRFELELSRQGKKEIDR